MALNNSIKFIKQFVKDNTFRGDCYKCNTKSELMKKLDFTEFEFEEAINLQLVQCQTYEEVIIVKDIKAWFNFF